MAKKIYDILPPKLANKVEGAVKEMGLAPKPKRTRGAKKAVSTAKASVLDKSSVVRAGVVKGKKIPLKELLIGGGVIICLLGVYLFTTLPSAQIRISPATEQLKLEARITADTDQKTVDSAKKIIPARYVEEQQGGSQEFPATGSASNDGKAAGTIRVYNKVSPSTPIVLKEGTHFLSDSGKYFVISDRITVPAMQGKTAGSVSVKVQAEESGDAYNIGASKFSVPKLSGTTYYYGIWAESTSAMAGGYLGDVKKVTADDLDNARDVFTKKLLAEAEVSLKSKLGSDEILLDGAFSKNVVEASASAKANAVAEKFTQTAKVKVTALVVKRSDLEQLVKANLVSNLSDGKTYLPESVNVAYGIDSVDIQGGVAKITMKSSAATYYAVNVNDLLDRVANKPADEIKNAITAKYGEKVSATTVEFWPFWVTKAPSNKDKITIEVVFP